MKNKFVQTMFAIFMILSVFVQNIMGVSALTEAPKTIIIVYEETYTNLGSDASAIRVRKAKYTENGTTKYGYVYCLEGGAGIVSENSSYNPDSTSDYADKETGIMNDDGINYITMNGFWGNGNIGAGEPSVSEKKDYAATQLAIWLYYYDVSQNETKYDMTVVGRKVSTLARAVRNNKYNSNSENYTYIVEKANKLCEGAKKARLEQVECEKNNSCSTINNAELKVSVDNKNLKLSSDGKYIESELITVSLKEIPKYTVSVNDSNFVVVDENGNNKTTFKDGDKIKVRASSDKVSASTNVTLNFKATSSERMSYQYYGGKYTYNGSTIAKQRLLFGAVFNNVKLEEKLDFTYNVTKTKVEFSKIDVTTGKELPGAHLEIKNSNGEVIESWVSTNETHYFELLPGKYTLTETIAPEGYELLTETIEFEVFEDGKTTKVVIENKPAKKEIKVEFSKIDVSTGKELPGAHLEIRDSNNNLVESWVSTEETHYFELLPGVYTLTETLAPEGYELSSETIEFEVKENGITKVVMENKPYIEVPITSLNASSVVMILGSLLFSLGLIMVYNYVKKESVQE